MRVLGVMNQAVALALSLSALACGSDTGNVQPPAPPMTERPAVCKPAPNGEVSPGRAPPTPPMSSQLHSTTLQADVPPPSISGGTLLTTRDGLQLVAADPDRDQVYFIDVASQQLSHVIALQPGDEPGRVVEDAAGRIHVVLRGAHGIASMTRAPRSAVVRRDVCDVPRGLAYDDARDQLHVACAEGRLVSLDAQPGGAIVRSVELGRDLRDVLVRGDALFVTRFRSAALLRVDATTGTTLSEQQPPSLFDSEAQASSEAGNCGMLSAVMVENTPTVAYRMLDIPGRGIAMLHQHARAAEVKVSIPNGYGGQSSNNCGPGIVHSAISLGVDGDQPITADLADLTLAVDMAVDPNAELLAVVSAGNWGHGSQLRLSALGDAVGLDFASASGLDGGLGAAPLPRITGGCLNLTEPSGQPRGQATAVAFTSPTLLAVQQREPAAISFIDLRTGQLQAELDLKQPSRADTGHELFHLRAGAGIACASCHAEAGDDGHVWTFEGIGPRRTQQLRGGILGTEPFHWNGDMADFPTLVSKVFVGRMGGFMPAQEQTDALSRWIDRQPELKELARDPSQVVRGQTLFESDAVGCGGCHNGSEFTNNQTADVGTGAALQVPALRGVAFRTPLMHNGCAKTLADRFNAACGGGDYHGRTSQLSAAQTADLIAYLETL
jgi:hypothetical protein